MPLLDARKQTSLDTFLNCSHLLQRIELHLQTLNSSETELLLIIQVSLHLSGHMTANLLVSSVRSCYLQRYCLRCAVTDIGMSKLSSQWHDKIAEPTMLHQVIADLTCK